MPKTLRRHFMSPVLLVCLALAMRSQADEALSFRVVVHEDLELSSLDCSDLSRVYLGKESVWPDGAAVEPIDRQHDSALFAAFVETVHCRPLSRHLSYWQRFIFSGRGEPPRQIQSDAALFTDLFAKPGAVGYVGSGTSVPPGLKVLKIVDCECSDSRDTRGAAAHSLNDDEESLAHQGDLRLFLMGDCDHGGRRAMLQNRSPHQNIGVVIERSQWVKGVLRASNTRYVTVPALGEQALGCTASGRNLELRYAIAETSNAGTGENLTSLDDRPARDLVALAAGKTCGRGGHGHEISVINQHPWRSTAVELEVQRLIHGDLKQSYRKTHVLGPGARKELGCGLDGNVERRVQMIRVEYR